MRKPNPGRYLVFIVEGENRPDGQSRLSAVGPFETIEESVSFCCGIEFCGAGRHTLSSRCESWDALVEVMGPKTVFACPNPDQFRIPEVP